MSDDFSDDMAGLLGEDGLWPEYSPAVNGAPPDPKWRAPRALVARLSGHLKTEPAPRTRVGILLLDESHLGRESEAAVRLEIYAASLAERILETAPEGSAWLGLSTARLLEQLDALASEEPSPSQPSQCRLVTHLDLLLARLDTPSRALFWQEARSNLPHRCRALLLAMPRDAQSLLPPHHEWTLWKQTGQTAELSGTKVGLNRSQVERRKTMNAEKDGACEYFCN